MKKMLKNKKGFSLIELLIVIAIMGVLAVIAFSMFSGVVANSRKKADVTQAGNIQKALVAYIVDTGDAKLEDLQDVEKSADIAASGAFVSTANWETVVRALQQDQTVKGTTYKAYLNPRNGASPATAEFGCQWNEHTGYQIDVYPDRMNATVVPVTASTITNTIHN